MKSKYCFFTLIGLCFLCLLFIQVRQAQENRQQQTRKTEEFIEASYAGDIDTILSLFPDSLYERLIADTIDSVSSEEEIPEFVGADIRNYIETIGILFGEDWEYSFKITNRYKYTKEDLEDLNYHYKISGVPDADFKQAAILTVEIDIAGINGTEGSQTILVPLVKEHGHWGIGQQIGSVYDTRAAEGGYGIYGRLLDGFSFSSASEAENDE
ncbi:MAG: hypothetical protein LUC98_04980 [Lachnospiraceae bacterium]|nr:hypothetical protein [Lachnospiraceae bacterium]